MTTTAHHASAGLIHGQAAVAPVPALRAPRGWSAAAGSLLADLGFTLINSHRPAAGSHLLVALRARPALSHFDPELLTCFAPMDERATITTVDRTNATDSPERTVLWGPVHVVDRLGVENRFLTFGGTLCAARIDAGLTVLDLRSPGPIVRWGGHSQGADDLSGAIGAFFGRLMVPVDFVSGAEAFLDATPAQVLYAAFLDEASGRLMSAQMVERDRSSTDAWLLAEHARVGRDEAVSEAAGELLVRMGLR